jgi:hypothetical protein
MMSQSITLQTAIEYVEELSIEEQDLVVELIQKRRTEKRRAEIAQNATQTFAALESGTAKRGTFATLKADLLDSQN